ncbi:oxidoreductase [Paenibacillus sp. 32O-W]|jgi:predicted dehydrogenase|uniref:Oxidoreductase n=1 Tax=Paenibacillus cisolokensis TaxID=1658519 RepID=A0ABQ4NBD0_9BACL|nr:MULTISPECIES: Gfo/Idh/MocA family oxidoreductase [Paenibacillus]ALS29770.1 oxidoreductase [Paenibacillus sp. 32O-W]GIQ65526.1 oxidoreductase [Paenibacillus cisolokensis]
MSDSPIRLGIIGAGAIGNVHMEAFGKTEGVEVTTVTDAYLPLAEKRAAEHGIGHVHENPQALLDDPDVDAVVICVPNQFHAPLAIEALEKGKHVLLEKPMAIDAEAARAIVEAKNRSGKVLMMSHQMRWSGISRALKQEIENGRVGRIYNAKAGWWRKKGIPGWGSWFTRKDMAGGGPLIDIGVHMLDLSLYLMGNPKPVSVYGTTYAEFGPKRLGTGNWGTPNWDGYYDVEDLATALIKLDNGATLSLEVSWAAHAAGLPQEPFIHLMGTEGGVAMIGDKGKYVTHEGDEVVEKDVEPLAGESDRLLLNRHFVECIREGKEPITSAMSGYTNSRILDAIYESSRTGHEVKLNWD